MSLRKLTIEQNDTGAFSADATVDIDIERVGVITRIDATVEITPSATLTAAFQVDGLNRVLRNGTIRGGSHTYMTLPGPDGGHGGTLLHYLNAQDGHGIGHGGGAVAAPVRTFTAKNFVFHAGSRPRDIYGRDNPFDLSAFIPAHTEGQLTFTWGNNGNDVLDDTVTISSATMRLTLHRLLGTLTEMEEEVARQGVVSPGGGFTGMIPAWSSVTHANAGTTTEFDAEQIDIVVGGFLSRIALLEQDATADRPIRAGDQVTDVAIKVPRTSEVLYQAGVEYLQAHMGAGDQLTDDSGAANNAAVATPIGPDFDAHAPVGVYIIDLRARSNKPMGRDYGWDLRRARNGDFRLGFLITTRTAGDDTLVLYERYQPTNLPLAAKIA